jgi:hypothetical protein
VTTRRCQDVVVGSSSAISDQRARERRAAPCHAMRCNVYRPSRPQTQSRLTVHWPAPQRNASLRRRLMLPCRDEGCETCQSTCPLAMTQTAASGSAPAPAPAPAPINPRMQLGATKSPRQESQAWARTMPACLGCPPRVCMAWLVRSPPIHPFVCNQPYASLQDTGRTAAIGKMLQLRSICHSAQSHSERSVWDCLPRLLRQGRTA